MLKKKSIIQVLLSLSILLVGLVMLGQTARAAVETQNADFEIQPVLPAEQVDNSLNYFDVKFKPGTTHVIKMRVENFTDHQITVKTDLQNGMTQDGGGMKFTKATQKLDASLKVPLTTIATIKKSDRTLKLAPKEATVISATIKMPQANFKGMIAGGWHFIEYISKKGNSSESVNSNYAYMVSIDLRGSHYQVYPELKYVETTPMLSGGHPALGIKLRNPKPMVLKKMSYTATIYKEGLFKDKHVIQKTKSSIAPNSSMTIPISWDYKSLKSGKYHVEVKVSGQNLWNDLPMNWHFKKTFSIKNQDVEKINKSALKRPVNVWIYVASASGAMLLMTIAGLLRILWLGK